MGPARALDGEGTVTTDRAAGGAASGLQGCTGPSRLPAIGPGGALPVNLQVVSQSAEEVAALSVVGYFGVAIFAALMVVWFWVRT